MEQKARGKITGMKFFKGEIDGKQMDSGTLFVEATLRGKDSKGYASQPYKCTGSELVKRIQHNPCPFVADFTLAAETDGKGALTQIVIEVAPIEVPRKAA